MESAKVGQSRQRSLMMKCLAVSSVLVCVLLVLLMLWAWLLWSKNAGVTATVGSFPYLRFAQQMTQVAVFGCAGIIAIWLAYWGVCRLRSS